MLSGDSFLRRLTPMSTLLGVFVVVQPRRSAFCRVYAQQGTEKLSPAEWDHVLVAIIDSNPTLSTASRSALATAAAFAARGKLTCLFLDDQGKEVDGSRIQLIQRQLEEKGFSNVHFMEEAIEHSSGQGSVAVGEAADSVGADLVVLSSAAVHEKHVDANLLAEFVPAPVLLLP